MNIRIAKLEDLEAMVDIYNQAISAGQKTADITPVTTDGRKKWFEEHSPDKYPILVAEKGESIVGYLTISAYRPGRQALRFTAEISYYVHFDYHRQGIASCLLQYAIDRCPSLQIKTLFAILLDSNQDSIRLLEKFGFEKWGHMPRVAEFDGIEVGHLYYGLRIENAPMSHVTCPSVPFISEASARCCKSNFSCIIKQLTDFIARFVEYQCPIFIFIHYLSESTELQQIQYIAWTEKQCGMGFAT